MFNINMFGYGLKKDEIDRNLPKDIKPLTNFYRKKPLWFDGDDPYDRHSHPIMVRIYEDVYQPSPIPTEAWYNYEALLPLERNKYYGKRFPLHTEILLQGELSKRRIFMEPDDVWWSAKIKRRSERLAYPDRQYRQTGRGNPMWLHQVWVEEELQAEAEEVDFMSLERYSIKNPIYFQPRNLPQLLRYTKDEHDIHRMDLKNQCPKAVKDGIDKSHDLIGYNYVDYGNNDQNRKWNKFMMSAVHFWHDHSEKYQFRVDEDPKGDIERCLEVLPYDGIGTLCIVREYYLDEHRRMGPIFRALQKAGHDGFDVIVVEPLYLGVMVENWIYLAWFYQAAVCSSSFLAIYTNLWYPGHRYTWGIAGWLSFVVFYSYKYTWEKDPLNNYDVIQVFEREIMMYVFPDAMKPVQRDLNKRCKVMERFRSGTLLNRNCTILKRRKFPYNNGLKKFVMRCSNLLCFGLMVWRTGWRSPGACQIPCSMVPFMDKEGNIDSLKWKWIAMPRLVEPKEIVPVKTHRLYDFLLSAINGGWFFGFALFGLIWHNWIRKIPILPMKYRAHVLDAEDLSLFYSHHPLEEKKLEFAP